MHLTELVLTVLTFLTKRVFNVLIYFAEFVRPVLMCLTEPALAVLTFLTGVINATCRQPSIVHRQTLWRGVFSNKLPFVAKPDVFV